MSNIKKLLDEAIGRLNFYKEQEAEVKALVEQLNHAAIRQFPAQYIAADLERNGEGPEHEAYASRVKEAFDALADAVEAKADAVGHEEYDKDLDGHPTVASLAMFICRSRHSHRDWLLANAKFIDKSDNCRIYRFEDDSYIQVGHLFGEKPCYDIDHPVHKDNYVLRVIDDPGQMKVYKHREIVRDALVALIASGYQPKIVAFETDLIMTKKICEMFAGTETEKTVGIAMTVHDFFYQLGFDQLEAEVNAPSDSNAPF